MPEQTPRRTQRRRPRWAAALGAALVIGGASLGWLATSRPESGSAPSGGASSASSASARSGTTATPVHAPREPGAPLRVRIPTLDVDAPVTPVRAPRRTLVPPVDPQRLGWWADGAKPGAERGSALVAGHTVHTGGGALDDLEDLGRGDLVVVRTDRGVLRYGVRRVQVFSKGAIADHAAELFSQDVPGRLVLVTCEDWDGERYLSNVVVTATPRA